MPESAGTQYLSQRQRYRTALEHIAAIDDEDIKRILRKALTAHVRQKFRGISKYLTEEVGIRFTCLPEHYDGKIEVEHAVPLHLVHNQILGLHANGTVNQDTYDLFSTGQSIEDFARAFMVGVLVTPEQHRLLNARAMHGEWAWLADIPPWDWNTLDTRDWDWERRPLWVRRIMNRYEHVSPPAGPLIYRPI